jgi:uncharacterized 2Fe-2S/4Fe-4S cluster protein (DUF4445 family)
MKIISYKRRWSGRSTGSPLIMRRTIPIRQIADAAVGNTVMHHLCCDFRSNSRRGAHTPCVRPYVKARARLGLAPGALHLPPVMPVRRLDHAAVLLAARSTRRSITLAIDIGTNTEICLNHKGVMTSVSCASGPAFEGAHIRFGMRAAPGAIEHVRLENEHLEIQTIAGEPPVGICGSFVGRRRATASLTCRIGRKMGAHPPSASATARLSPCWVNAPREPISSPRKMCELQLAKAAIRPIRWPAAGIRESDIGRVIIAGALAPTSISERHYDDMLPAPPLERFHRWHAQARARAWL